MVNLGVLPLSATARFYFSTAAADGGEENFSATLEEADIVVMKDGAAMTLSASTITITAIATGIYEVDIDQTNDADFTAGSTYWAYVDPNDETIDSQAVSGVLGCWSTETASQRAQRDFQEKVYPGHIVATTTNNSTTSINLTEIVDAQTTKLAGEVLAVCDVTDDRVILVRVTAFTYPQATVEGLDGAAMAFTVAAGDMIWRVGQFTATTGSLGTIAAAGDQMALVDDAITADKYDQSTAFPLAAASSTLATASALTTHDSAIKALLPAALVSGRMDAHIGSIADAVLTAAKFAAGAFDAVWSVATRILTAATNITSTGGTTVPQTGDSFARIGATGSGLTSLAQASVATEARLAELDAGNLPADIASRASQTSVDDLDTLLDTIVAEVVTAQGEPGQGAPPAAAPLADKVAYLYKAWRNKSDQTATTHRLYADDGTTVDQKRTIADDGTTFESAEVVTGP